MPLNQDQELLDAIHALMAGHEESVRIPMSAVNQGIAQLVADNGKSLSGVSNLIVKRLTKHTVDNSNDIELLGTTILQGINTYLQENDLLLNHLASAAGLINPGDPLEAALVSQVAEEPELAYSATLLIALRDALPWIQRMAIALERMAGAAGAAPAATQAEIDTETEVAEQEAKAPVDLADWPVEDLS